VKYYSIKGKLNMKINLLSFHTLLFLSLSVSIVVAASPTGKIVYIRINQLGYLPEDSKVAILFSNESIRGKAELINKKTRLPVLSLPPEEIRHKSRENFAHYYQFDFSKVREEGIYFIRSGEDTSRHFLIDRQAYSKIPDKLLKYMRQQQCGYNPFWDQVCHSLDGRVMYAPIPDSTFIDVSGGWHDAGDDLKYLLTGSYATAVMLLAYEMQPAIFADTHDKWGHSLPNGIPDVLDEARWGLDWMHKLHPRRDQLYHQVGDDRDHIGWKYPFRDSSDYGWGKGSYRVAYFADGKPQGLGPYQSDSDGIANLAGRFAAAMAIAARIWRDDLSDSVYSEKCRRSAIEVYRLGMQKQGVQQGNSYGSPYRYAESNWADDMEWGAAELYWLTGEKQYLDEAIQYAAMIGSESWMGKDSSNHYQYYPFLNAGHFSLYGVAPREVREKLADWYAEGIEKCYQKSKEGVFEIGVPFIWCSNNLVVALIAQCYLYEQMTGDSRYHRFMIEQRDWLLGRNPWGTSMLVGIPAYGETPHNVHASTFALTGREITGGLVDGPVRPSIYNSLEGLFLSKPDEFSAFQTNYAVYHDDIADYSTNEPTMDGTAAAILALTLFNIP
jgi:endoglucanase